MADTKLSDLTAGGAVNATDIFYNVVTAGVGGVKTTAAQLKTFMSASPTLVTPTLGVAVATSIAIGGATLGANALAITGHVLVEGVTSTGATGTGAFVFASTPTLVTPVLGVATATSINRVALTAPATSATLTIADGKTLTVSNTLTFTGTDSSSIAFGGGGTVPYTSNNLSVFAATTSAQLAGVISDETGSGALVFATTPTLVTPVLGVATGTSLALGGATIGSDALGVTGTTTFNGAVTLNAAALILSGNQSIAAWTTAGIKIKGVAATLTDTTSSGTVAAAYTNVLGGDTIAASSATTFTDYYETFIVAPVVGSGVTFTRSWSLGVSGAIGSTFTSVASQPAALFSGTVFTGGTATTTKPHVLIEAAGTTSTAWNTNGTQLGVNAVNGWSGNLIDLLNNNTSRFKVSSGGGVTATGAIATSGTSAAIGTSTAIPAGGTAGVGYKFSSATNFGVFFGSGAPSLAAAKGSLYLRSDGSGATDRAYINTDGSTTWTALTTVG